MSDTEVPRVERFTVGPWLVLDEVDAGSCGFVFRARDAHQQGGPLVALKVARHPRDSRFAREVEALQRVQHFSLPRLEGHGEWAHSEGQRHPYIAMELVQGLSLYAWAKESQATSRQYLRVLAQVARALAALHAAGFVHRDVKGDNIVVTPEGRAVLLDLGCCWYPSATPLTETAMPPGTTPYRPPEMLRFAWRFRKDPKARYASHPADDLYSLGVAAYKALTGSYLPPVTESEEVRARIVPPSQWCTCAPELEALVMSMLADRKSDRGTAIGLAEALEVAARGGAHLDQRVELRGSSSKENRTHESSLHAWLPWVSAGIVSGWMALGAGAMCGSPRPEPLPVASDWHTPSVDVPDAGVGEEALLSLVQTSRPIAPASSVALPMPKAPQPGQKKPPCEPRSEVVVMGVCWVVLGVRPPCETAGYEYDGKCLRATFDAPRDPTSGGQ
ncbi:serine/threonine protein kinase [Hyalangium versicolor]|uniref:serine/threonine protein kinase n=1 Tax=Hyalangium versicolor TaxID=2861190 RepID=UPI001CCA93C7|nr:serine/threonine-protein kinase [Hyalangium versicolor]